VSDPTKGARTVETDPWDTTASPFGWQNDGSTTYTTTRGNNGIAQANYEGDNAYLNDYRPTATGSNFNFDFNPAWTNYKTYSNSSVTQLWYTANMYHDLLYTLGFNEAAGNFETSNDGKGGKGGDAVILNAQDGSGTNNANFATPVDGQAGRMRMYMWTVSTPNRDCAFDSGVIIHEYTHGLSTRLTGGPANSNCLTVLEAGGMGEGWGDFMAIAIHVKTTDTRTTNYPLGDWVDNKAAGIRAYLYSTSLTTNPLTYKSVNSQTEVHSIGTTWATILYEVLWNLIDKHGSTTARRPTFDANGVPTDGRFLAMKLVLDGMAL
jgi:extracellular elastinolytic metalloproteinase